MMRNSPKSQAGSQTRSLLPVSVDCVLGLSAGILLLTTYCFLFSRRARILERARRGARGGSTQPFYDKQITAISGLHALLNWQASNEAKQGFFSTSAALWESIKA